jgi:hypothetical protein
LGKDYYNNNAGNLPNVWRNGNRVAAMTSNQTFAGMIAHFRTKAYKLRCDYSYNDCSTTLEWCADEAQVIETKLRGRVAEYRKRALDWQRRPGKRAVYGAIADELEAILGPEQVGERTSR